MSKSNSSVIDEVIRVEKRWVQAHRDLDLATLEEILAEDYVQIRADGSVIGKAEALQSYGSGKRKWDYADSDDYRISVYGDVAILLGRWIGRGENDGQRFDYTARFMAIYFRRDGIWRLVADQATALSE
jgi:ketosteroid isomerase-like protein